MRTNLSESLSEFTFHCLALWGRWPKDCVHCNVRLVESAMVAAWPPLNEIATPEQKAEIEHELFLIVGASMATRGIPPA